MTRIIIFLTLSIPVIIISRRTLLNARSHGFYRFLCWECILWLFATNFSFWFIDPFKWTGIISWLCLIISGYLVIHGAVTLKKSGNSSRERSDEVLYKFEQTTTLVETGIYRYIRHPLYSSLLFLTWGIALKHIITETVIFASISTLFLVITSLFDEKECIAYFGAEYQAYMRRSKRFIPFIF